MGSHYLRLALCVAATVLLATASEAHSLPPSSRIHHAFKDFTLEVPDNGACLPAGVGEKSVHLTLRFPDPTWLRQELKLAVPPFADRPCPAPGGGVDVQLYELDGSPAMLGPGNMLSPALDGAAVDLATLPMSAVEARVLRAFFDQRTVRPLAGREPPVLYNCEGVDCRVAYREASAIVTVAWRKSDTRAAPHELVDYVASHLQQWSQRDPCEDTAYCSVRDRWAYEQGRYEAQGAFAAGDRRGVSVEVVDTHSAPHSFPPGFLCPRLGPIVVKPAPGEYDTRQVEWALGYNDRIWQLGGELKQGGCEVSPSPTLLRTPPRSAQRSLD